MKIPTVAEQAFHRSAKALSHIAELISELCGTRKGRFLDSSPACVGRFRAARRTWKSQVREQDGNIGHSVLRIAGEATASLTKILPVGIYFNKNK